MLPKKQGGVEVSLKLADLLTDRGLGDLEILGCTGKTQAPAGCLEGAQNIESWAFHTGSSYKFYLYILAAIIV